VHIQFAPSLGANRPEASKRYKAFLELESCNSLKSKLATLLPKFLDTQLSIVPQQNSHCIFRVR